jgi:hypothetical protein
LDKKEASPAAISLFPKACEPEEEKISPKIEYHDSGEKLRGRSSKEIIEEDNDDNGLEFDQ